MEMKNIFRFSTPKDNDKRKITSYKSYHASKYLAVVGSLLLCVGLSTWFFLDHSNKFPSVTFAISVFGLLLFVCGAIFFFKSAYHTLVAQHKQATSTGGQSAKLKMSTVTSYTWHNEIKETPRRYFNLGVLCCCIAGVIFFIGIILMVFGSSPSIPEAIWITGIVLLLLGGLLFVMGLSSIGLYFSREDKRKSEIEFINTDHYASSSASARSIHSNNIYLIE